MPNSNTESQGGIVTTPASTGGAVVEVMDLTRESALERQKHEEMLVELEAKKRAFQVDVPTLPEDVRTALRSLRQPVRLFGENLANVRDRLRMTLARQQVVAEQQRREQGSRDPMSSSSVLDESRATSSSKMQEEEEEQVTKYTRALPELVEARDAIAQFSLARAQSRLERERNFRVGAKRKRARLLIHEREDDENEAEVTRIDNECMTLYKSVRNLALEGSQYGDKRALSAICTFEFGGEPLVATGSWSATIKLWDGSSPELDLLGIKELSHEDRVMGIDVLSTLHDVAICATASIDLTGKLWRIEKEDNIMTDENDDARKYSLSMKELAVLRGHAARLSSTAFHPMGRQVATTSFDHTWRLWDVETGSEILLQDGHAQEVYGIGFHPDGSLVSTTDFAGVVHNWDLRTGKSICHFEGHAKRVLCSEYSPNGFQLATAGDDGTIKIWDLRKRRSPAISIPAHSNLVSQLRFEGEILASSSFDGTAKVWSARDWKILSTLRGHEGKVMGLGIVKGNSIVTSGYDKTIKLWK